MSRIIIGKCSNCGGNVSVPEVYHSVVPPVPTCDHCGAKKKSDLPTIEMENPKTNKNWQTERAPNSNKKLLHS